jgi:hypothetical protein
MPVCIHVKKITSKLSISAQCGTIVWCWSVFSDMAFVIHLVSTWRRFVPPAEETTKMFICKSTVLLLNLALLIQSCKWLNEVI